MIKMKGTKKPVLTVLAALLLMLLSALGCKAEELAAPSLYILGESIWDYDHWDTTPTAWDEYGYPTEFPPAELPQGITFDPAAFTVTLTNFNHTMDFNEGLIENYSHGGGKTTDLTVRLVGENVIRCQDGAANLSSELIHNNGNIIITGPGSLTVENATLCAIEAFSPDWYDVKISGCTLNISNHSRYASEFIDCRSLFLDNCNINLQCSQLPSDSGRWLSVIRCDEKLVMNHADFQLHTSDNNPRSCYITVPTGLEFHNSQVTVTGKDFKSFSNAKGVILFDNSTIDLTKVEYAGGITWTASSIFNFTNKHQIIRYSDVFPPYDEGVFLNTYDSSSICGSEPGYTDSGFFAQCKISPVKTTPAPSPTGPDTPVKPVVKVSKIQIIGTKSATEGLTTKLMALVSPVNAAYTDVTWKSSNTQAATVSSKGVVTFKKGSGGKKAVITATAKDGSGVKASVTVISKRAVKKITLKAASTNIAAGKRVTVKATVSPSNAANKGLVWKTSSSKLAAVTSNGIVTLKKASAGRTVIITATAKDGSKVKGSIRIASKKGIVKAIRISGSKTVRVNKTTRLKAAVTATAGANKKLLWSSSSKRYATVSQSGVVKGLKTGKGKYVTITAKSLDGSNKKASFKIKIL